MYTLGALLLAAVLLGAVTTVVDSVLGTIGLSAIIKKIPIIGSNWNLLVAIGMGILLSVNGLLLETLSFRVYNRSGDMLRLFAMAVLENFGYRQLNTLWRVRGMWQWMSRRKHQWGVMKRSGQWSQG